MKLLVFEIRWFAQVMTGLVHLHTNLDDITNTIISEVTIKNKYVNIETVSLNG